MWEMGWAGQTPVGVHPAPTEPHQEEATQLPVLS